MDSSEILAHFRHVSKVGGSQWRADCPACGDTKQHLYINFAPGGKTLLDCKKGCLFGDIVAAAGMQQKDFFADECPNDQHHKKWEFLREHIYNSANGQPIAKKVIYKMPDGGKSAVWMRHEHGQYIKGLEGRKIPLYHIDKIPPDGDIYIAEGEKDVETLERLGYAATTSPNGAGAKWRRDFADFFKNRDVIIITDNDDAGTKYGSDAAECIRSAAASVKIIRAADIYSGVRHKEDISDIAAALGDDETKRLLSAAVSAAVPLTKTEPKPRAPAAETPVTDAEPPPRANPIAAKFAAQHPETFPFNDRGNSALFGYIFGEECRFNVTAGKWYIYRGGIWMPDEGGMLTSRLAKELHSELIKYTPNVDEQHQKGYIDNLNKMSRLTVREAMIKDARDVHFCKSEDFDKDEWLFNCRNGVYDLRNGYFRPHRPGDMMAKVSNVFFDENADCPIFKKFLREITEDNIEKASFLQTLLGYCLTGDTSEECFFILFGSTTRNGKGTLMETFSHLLNGEDGYAVTANPDTFAVHLNRDSRQASGDIARLKGMRFVNVSEPPKNMTLDAARMKTLTGRDTITARHLREREIQFIPQFKLLMNTNYLPRVNDETIFTSDRVRIVTFDRHFGEGERDPKLKDKLRTRAEISGIFNWCLKGLERYKREGLYIPHCVKAATAQYRNVCDNLQIFFNECFVETIGQNTKAKEAYELYRQWCRANNFSIENKTDFMAGLRRKNVLAEHGRVDGATYHNVIVDYSIAPEYLPGSAEEYNRQPPF